MSFLLRWTVFLWLVSSVFALPSYLKDNHDLIPQDYDVETVIDTAKHVFDIGVEKHRDPTKTIYESLSSKSHFSKIVKLIGYDNETLALLNATGAGVTFLAPDNHAFPKPKKHPPPKEDVESYFIDSYLSSPSLDAPEEVLADILYYIEEDPDKREKWHKFLKLLLHRLLSYHILPAYLEPHELAWNSTFATTLLSHDGSFDGQARRIKIDGRLLPPSLNVNVFSRILASWPATNGIVHAINHPLLPPPSILDGLFLFPQVFSTLTSAVQKVSLESSLAYNFKWNNETQNGTFVGAPSLTFFAPTNKAFNSLPPRLLAFLFSPFGEKVLKKLLEFHIVPDYIIFTEWHHQVSPSSSAIHLPSQSRPETEIFFHALIPTLLPEHSIPIFIRKSKVLGHFPLIVLAANGYPIKFYDFVARNGAVHVVNKLLNPKKKYGGHKLLDEIEIEEEEDDQGWEDWEDWLLEWAGVTPDVEEMDCGMD